MCPYRGERHSAVGHEVVVQAWEIGAATVDELQGGLDVKAEPVATLNGAEKLLCFRLQELSLSGEVLQDCSGLGHGGRSRDIVDRSARRKRAGSGRAQEGLVFGAESHGAARGVRSRRRTESADSAALGDDRCVLLIGAGEVGTQLARG